MASNPHIVKTILDLLSKKPIHQDDYLCRVSKHAEIIGDDRLVCALKDEVKILLRLYTANYSSERENSK